MLIGPQFEAPTLGPLAQADGSKPIAPADLTGRYQVVLFHVGPHHKMTSRLIREFSEAMADFQALDCQLLAVSKDSVATLQNWVEEEFSDLATKSALMPVLSDSAGVLARGYGLHYAGEGGRAGCFNAVFIVDRLRRVRFNCLLELHTGHSAAHILRKVAAFAAVEAGDKLVMAGSSSGTKLDELIVENDMAAIRAFYCNKYGKGTAQKPASTAVKKRTSSGPADPASADSQHQEQKSRATMEGTKGGQLIADAKTTSGLSLQTSKI
jgi:peroxiredoxin (alkyl hydroperoxide reductase subunit C)